MQKLKNKIAHFFYTSWLGNLYFEILLYLDRRSSKSYLTNQEVAQIVRQYSLLGEGVKEVKTKINALIETKTAEDYNNVLSQIENMISLAERKADDPKAQLAKVLRQMYVKKGTKDINSDLDRAKMIDKKIQDTYELHSHIEQRQILRQIRKAKQEGDMQLAAKLEKEWANRNVRS